MKKEIEDDIQLLELFSNDSLSDSIIQENLEERILVFNEELKPTCLNKYILYVLKWNREDKNTMQEERKPIKIYINSIGGDALSCLMFCDIIKSSKTPIVGIGFGCVASAAYYIFISCHLRICLEGTSFLQHDGTITLGENSNTKTKQIMAHLNVIDNQFKELVLELTEMTEEYYDQQFSKEYWMGADEAQILGCVDKIIGKDCELDYIL